MSFEKQYAKFIDNYGHIMLYSFFSTLVLTIFLHFWGGQIFDFLSGSWGLIRAIGISMILTVLIHMGISKHDKIMEKYRGY